MPQDSVTLELRGVDEVVKKLIKDNAQIEAELKKAIGEAQDLVRQRAEKYPPKRPSSTYQRTGLLGRGWATRKPSAFEGIVYNRVKYAPWVQGHETQAKVHQGRWPTTGDIVKELDRKITGMFEEAVKKAIR